MSPNHVEICISINHPKPSVALHLKKAVKHSIKKTIGQTDDLF